MYWGVKSAISRTRDISKDSAAHHTEQPITGSFVTSCVPGACNCTRDVTVAVDSSSNAIHVTKKKL